MFPLRSLSPLYALIKGINYQYQSHKPRLLFPLVKSTLYVLFNWHLHNSSPIAINSHAIYTYLCTYTYIYMRVRTSTGLQFIGLTPTFDLFIR